MEGNMISVRDLALVLLLVIIFDSLSVRLQLNCVKHQVAAANVGKLFGPVP